MKKTWKNISQKWFKIFESLQDTIVGDLNQLRTLHRECSLPAIPYMGLYIGDLSRLSEVPTKRDKEGYINFSKMRTQATILKQIDRFHQDQSLSSTTPTSSIGTISSRYNLKYIPEYQRYIQEQLSAEGANAIVMDNKELMVYSLQVEPDENNTSSPQPPPH